MGTPSISYNSATNQYTVSVWNEAASCGGTSYFGYLRLYHSYYAGGSAVWEEVGSVALAQYSGSWSRTSTFTYKPTKGLTHYFKVSLFNPCTGGAAIDNKYFQDNVPADAGWNFTNASVSSSTSGGNTTNTISWNNPADNAEINAAVDDWYYRIVRRKRKSGTTTWEGFEVVSSSVPKTSTSYTDTRTGEECYDYHYELWQKYEDENQIFDQAATNLYHIKNIVTPKPLNLEILSDSACAPDRIIKWKVKKSDIQECTELWFDVMRANADASGNPTSGFSLIGGRIDGVLYGGRYPNDGNHYSYTEDATYVYIEFNDHYSLVTGNTYAYKLIAKSRFNANGVIGTTVIDNIADNQPHTTINTNLAIPSQSITWSQNNGAKTINVNWVDGWNNEEKYAIFRRPNGSSPGDEVVYVDNIPSSTSGSRSKTFSVTEICQEYIYSLKVYNGCSGYIQIGSEATFNFTGNITDTYGDTVLKAYRGYRSDYVQLDWIVVNNSNSLTKQHILRRELGSNATPTFVAEVSKETRTYKDFDIDANTLYEYFLTGQGFCNPSTIYTDTTSTIGFRAPSGLITGRVEYTGGVSVKGCKIVGQSVANNNSNKSIYFDGAGDYAIASSSSFDQTLVYGESSDISFFLGSGEKTIEFWLNPTEFKRGVVFRTLNGALGEYLAFKTPTAGNQNWEFSIGGGNFPSFTLDVNPNEWHHYAITYANDTLRLYVDGDNKDASGNPMFYPVTLNLQGEVIVFGNYGTSNDITNAYKGYMDEIRMWGVARTQEEIQQNMNGYLLGNETGLGLYFRCNENAGNLLYDASFVSGNNYNNRAAGIYRNSYNNVTWSSVVPAADKLGNIGYTDAGGNYTIKNVLYADNGELFNLVPYIANHQFQPNNRTVYIGTSSPVQNEQDFEDISAFPVTGHLFYGEDTSSYSCPAEGVFVKVDGTIAVKDGQPVMTKADGSFEVSVPIGEHFISFEKSLHTFAVGRFPTTGKHNFQQPISGLTFIDNTKVKVIGRIAGGKEQEDLPVGFNKGKNNIGTATISFKSTLGCYTDTVTTNQYGEYEADLFPIEYTVQGAAHISNPLIYVGSNPALQFNGGSLDNINLTNIPPLQYNVDTIKDPSGAIVLIDSVSYNLEKSYIHRENHSLFVLDMDGNTFNKGDSEIITYNADSPDTVDVSLLQNPVFTHGNDYNCLLKVTEVYVNQDSAPSPIYDTVGVSDADITINNGISGELVSFSINSPKGDSVYTFRAGEPNIAGSYTKNLQIIATRGNYSAPTFNLDAYVFGSKQGGVSFTTTGPEIPEHILRDPPGSDSYAYLSKGTEISTNLSWSLMGNVSTDNEYVFMVGADFMTGWGIATTTDISGDISTTISTSTTSGAGTDYTETLVIEEDIATSDDPSFVGADADLFIGKSTNISFGTSDYLKLIPIPQCGGTTTCSNADSITSAKGIKYKIGTRKAMSVNPGSYNTYFIYTQKHIEQELIPDLIALRDQTLTSSPYYTSNVPATDPLYGENNDDPRWANPSTSTPLERENADFSGQSYTFTTSHFGPNDPIIDSVRWYNQQIRIWRNALAYNEEMKVNAVNGQNIADLNQLDSSVRKNINETIQLIAQQNGALENNISFSAGSSYGRSITLSNELTTMFSFEVEVSNTIGSTVGAEINGTGVESDHSFTVGATFSTESSSSNARSITYGYELADGDVGDFYSVDVLDGGSLHGPIFKTVGGETSCPWEDQIIAKYYDTAAHHVIQPATVRREQPKIEITPALQVGIPSDQDAIFTIKLSNENQEDVMTYALEVDDASNPDGAILTIDGLNPNRPFQIGPGQTLVKTLVVKKNPQVNTYNDIALSFKSECDENKIFDEASFSVSFIPTCTKSDFLSPVSNWVLNNNFKDTLPIIMNDYDLNFYSFEKAVLQYKPSTSSIWINQKEFYNMPSAGLDTLLLSRSNTYTDYDWNVKNQLDGTYDIRLKTVCANNVERFSPVYSGLMDRVSPKNFGQPTPADGILEPNDEISIKFNETINSGLINSGLDIDVRGVLNSTDLAHYTSLYFNGTSKMDIPFTNLENRSFSVEFFAKRDSLGLNQVIAKQQGQWEIGFDANDKVYFDINGTRLTSSATVVTKTDWKHYAVTFNNNTKATTIYIDGASDISGNVNETVTGNSLPIIVGDSYYGNIHELRLWGDERTGGEITLNYLKSQPATAPGLIGYWQMQEAEGNVVTDKTGRRAATHNADWSFDQEARAIEFDGVDDYFEIPSPTLVFSHETDFTISFWFKGSNGTNATLMSSGNIDSSSTQYSPSYWAIQTDNANKLYVKNAGHELKVSDSNYFDNKWHHFALVVNRQGNSSVYMDGDITATTNSQVFNVFGSDKVIFGGYAHKLASGNDTITDYLQGSIDEIQMWYAARQKDQIERDAHYRLTGDEYGLMAYFPFETYTSQPSGFLSLTPTSADLSDKTSIGLNPHSSNMANGLAYTNQTPAIKIERPVEAVTFNYAVNNDQIIITPTTSAELIENVELDITVRNIQDLNGNKMASAVTWLAYVDKNQVVWSDDLHQADVILGNNHQFTVDVVNNGGSTKSFTIGNLPMWLQASQTSGSVSALSSQTITFTVLSGLNIGNYEENISLTTDFGYDEILTVKINVKKTPPTWSVDPNQYQYSMGVVGELQVETIISTDTADIVAAFINGQVRGVSKVKYIPSGDVYRVFLNVYSNSTATTDSIKFKVWDASKGEVLDRVSPFNLTFSNNAILGTMANPIIINADNKVARLYDVNPGWNWLSFPLTFNNDSSNKVIENFAPAVNDIFRNQLNYNQFDGGLNSWIGSMPLVNNEKSFRILTAKDTTFEVIGTPVDVTTTPVPVNVGWNWIGYLHSINLGVNEALSSLNFSSGDVIKSQQQFAIYDNILGWQGSLTTLEPQKGYMLSSSVAGNIYYPKYTNFSSRSASLNAANEFAELLPYRDYPTNMSVIADIDFPENTLLAAYDKDNKLRGLISANNNKYFLTVHGEMSDEISFKLLNNELNEVETVDTVIPYQTDGIVYLNIKRNTIKQANNNELTVYPNPFKDVLNISYNATNESNITITLTDAVGRTVANIINTTAKTGVNTYTWKAGSTIPNGVYFVKVNMDGEIQLKKFIKQ